MERLHDRVAVVTGGASGLGKAIGQRLALEGAVVIITDIQSDLGQATATECGFEFFEQDVSEERSWTDLIQEIEERFKRLDILVNNAGILGAMDAVNPETTRLSDWKKVFSVNVDSVFLGCRAVLPAMRRVGGGSIINISSVAGLLATPYASAYGASKAAVRQLTKSVAQHCVQERLNIRCNSVHPGIVRTPLWDRNAAHKSVAQGVPLETIVAEAEAIVPMHEFTSPNDVAAAVAFLASDDARHITGEKVIVDGGIVNCDSYHIKFSKKYLVAQVKSSNK